MACVPTDKNAGYIQLNPDFAKSHTTVGNVTIDMGLVGTVQCDESVCRKLEQEYPFKQRVEFNDALKFKYLIVPDGNTWPARLQTYLRTNSVILYNGIFTDWFNVHLVPWKHYIPFALDSSDLEERLLWVQENDKDAKRIMENARALMGGLGEGQMKCFSLLTLMEYKRLYDLGHNKRNRVF
jgi:Glycosyl transferase family 90